MTEVRSLPAEASQAPAYFHSLAALRGVAAIAVALYHLLLAYRLGTVAPPPGMSGLLPLFERGWFGVDVFFFISGYGLSVKLADRRYAGFSGAAAFARNRFWRIYLPFWACCFCALALAVSASAITRADWRLQFPSTPGALIAGAFLMHEFTQTPPLLPIVTWALVCELVFYVIVAGGIMLRPQVSDALLIGLAVGVAFVGLSGRIATLAWPFAFWPQFACGIVASLAITRRIKGAARETWIVAGFILLLGVLAALTGNWRVAATTLVALGLIAVWPADRKLSRQPIVRLFAWCGMISYPLFLLHIPLGSRLMTLGHRLAGSDRAASWLVLAGVLGACLALAWALHRWVERPAQQLARLQSLGA